MNTVLNINNDEFSQNKFVSIKCPENGWFYFRLWDIKIIKDDVNSYSRILLYSGASIEIKLTTLEISTRLGIETINN